MLPKENLEKDSKVEENVNIFDELSSGGQDSELNIKTSKSRNTALLVSKVLQVLSVLALVGFLVSLGYILIQKNENISNNSLLSPICGIFLGDVKSDGSNCSSITYMNIKLEQDIDSKSKKQTSEISNILGQLYEKYNFTKTKSVLFVGDKSNNKLEILKILDKFDAFKTSFDFEKSKIQCRDISINDKNILSMKCDAFSTGFERGIRGFDGSNDEKVRGTSISVANSFINYLEKESKDFSVVNRQKVFTSESVNSSETGFTNKTSFDLVLKFNSNTLSL